jgi:ATP-binding cassette, subfamily B, bacterial
MTAAYSTQPRQAFELARALVAPYKWRVVGAMAALVFTAGITLSLGQGLRLLVDQGFTTGSPALLNQSVALFFALVLALAVGTCARFYLVSWIGERVVADVRREVFDHLIDMHPGFFETNRGLEIQSRLTADTTVLQAVIGSTVSIALRNALMLIGGVILLFVTNPKLTSIVMLAIPLVLVPILVFGRRVRALSRQSQDRVADVGSYVGEILGQVRTVQAFNHQAHDRQRFSGVVEDAFLVARHRIRQRTWLTGIVIGLVLGAIGVMLWVGGMDVIEGRITAGELAAFVFYSLIVGVSAGALSEVIGELQRAAGAGTRIVELLNTQREISAPEHPRPLPSAAPARIDFEAVRFAYPTRPDTLVLDDLSLTIAAGETLALVGPSGAGKSTLLDLLLRFYDVTGGHISLDGIDLRELDPAEARRCFAWVGQNPGLFYGTIADNIAYGMTDATRDQIEQAAIIAHAHEFISELPQGYETPLGDGGIGLSGGQKQRLAIARALLVNAPVLLLDEATSALDARSEHLIQQALPALMKGRTCIVIAHRLATVKSADRIAVMDQGRVVALGTHAELVRSNPLYARLAELQFVSTETTPDQASQAPLQRQDGQPF